ncbi:MAG: glycosyltransferase family 9 protein [Bacteroidaceae bacterium]|nr:glycosyltransferase family 9 protein [Bacteroidaceae bacterium]
MHILVARFSAMGDVAMTVPVIHSLAAHYPDVRITVLTRRHFTPLFQWMPSNVQCVGINLNDFKGVFGLERLYRSLDPGQFDAFADIHDVLRTKYLRMRFRIDGKKVVAIDKGRAEKKALIGNGMTVPALKPMTERYREVFRGLGLDFPLTFTDMKPFLKVSDDNSGADSRLIGIAPFAAHEGKIYPLDRMRQVADMLADRGYRVYLFGAGEKESEILESWQREGVESVAGKLGGLTGELLLMSRLSLMISMDSSNMHMAAIMGTPTLSVWGATHPKAGFLAWRQSLDSAVQLDIPCRPCSVYGNKPCQFGDFRCLNGITPEMIVANTERLLS